MYLIFSLIFWLLSTECTTITGKDDLRWSGSISNGIGGESCLVSKTCELSNIYYSPKLFGKNWMPWSARVSEDFVKLWLMKQAIWQIYLPAPKHIPRPMFDVTPLNSVHQADLLFLPHDRLRRGRNEGLQVRIDVASRFKAAQLLTSKESSEVSKVLQRIYKGPLP